MLYIICSGKLNNIILIIIFIFIINIINNIYLGNFIRD